MNTQNKLTVFLISTLGGKINVRESSEIRKTVYLKEYIVQVDMYDLDQKV